MEQIQKITGLRAPRIRRIFRAIFICTLVAFLFLFFRADSSTRWVALMKTRTNLSSIEVDLTHAEWSRTDPRIFGRERPPKIVEKASKIEIDMYDSSVRGESQNRSQQSHHEKIKVIVVPFTHTDPGWLRTFDSYTKDTDDTLNAMFDFLSKHGDMTFMWAETIFLEHWWRKQDDMVRNLVKQLVKQGRLDLVTGSWVMTDEANPYFPVTVDNIVEGFQFINKEFGVKPSVLFSLDPFGHSNSIAYLYSQAGIHREVINRISTGAKSFLQDLQAQRFIWKQYFDDTSESDVWTHVFPYSHYDIPSTCGPDSNMCCEIDVLRYYKRYQCGGDVKPIDRSNVERKAEGLSKQLMLMSKIYESNVVIMFYGDDFRFTTSFEWKIQYEALRFLFDEINSKKQIEIGFGTITSFFEELEQWYAKNGRQPPSLKGDFFPYEVTTGAWSGYYSTRPFYKAQERRLHWLIRAADLLSARVASDQEAVNTTAMLNTARKALLLFQHHDAITGTSRVHVMQDYSMQLHNASLLASAVIESSVGTIYDSEEETVEYYESNNATTDLKVLNMTNKRELLLKVINTLPYHLEDVISVRVDCVTIEVKSSLDRQSIEAQIEPYIHNGKIDNETFLLSFRTQLYPLGISRYQLIFDDKKTSTKLATVSTRNPQKVSELNSVFILNEIEEEDFYLNGTSFSTLHNVTDGMLKGVIRKNKKYFGVTPNFLIYLSNGGAYEMNIRDSEYEEYFTKKPPLFFLVIQGPVKESVHIFAEGLYNGLSLKKVTGILGEQINYFFHIDVRDDAKKSRSNSEVAFQFGTSLSNPKFYSDSVGIQLLRRKRGEFFPMPTSLVLEDSTYRITVSSNVPHGCREICSGFEAIVERIIHSDDGHGLGSDTDSIPNDNLPVDMRFTILVEDLDKAEDDSSRFTAHTIGGHVAVQSTIYPPIVLISSNSSFTPPSVDIPSLPCELQLLGARPLPDNRRLLTIFHHGTRSTSLTRAECGGDLQTFLKSFLEAMNVTKVEEADLSGLSKTAKVVSVAEYDVPTLKPFKFLSLLLTIE